MPRYDGTLKHLQCWGRFVVFFGLVMVLYLLARPVSADAAICSELGNNLVDTDCHDCIIYSCDCYEMPAPALPSRYLCCKDTAANNVTGCYDTVTKQKYYGETPSPSADATYVSPDYTGETAAMQQEETNKIFFIPQFTIPGSDFIAGEAVQVNGSTLGDYIAALYIFFVSVAGILSVVMMMFGGVKYVVSFGSPQKISDARDTITSAMIGLAIALGSYVILLTISPRLVEFQGLQNLGSGIGSPLEYEELQMVGVKYGVSYKPVSRNVATYDAMLLAEAGGDKNYASWLKAIMLVESSGNPQAKTEDENGNTLACGLMQMRPSTAGVSCSELINSPQLSIHLGSEYFRELLADTCPERAQYKSKKWAKCEPDPDCPTCLPKKTQCENGKLHYAIAAYNGGQGANCGSIDCPGSTWWECEANPGFAETRNYVAKVEDAFNKIQNDPAFAWSQ